MAQLEFVYTAGGSVIWYTTLENSVAIFYRVQHPPTITPSNSAPRYFPREMKTRARADLYMNVHGSVTHKNKKLGSTQSLSQGPMAKMWYSLSVVYHAAIRDKSRHLGLMLKNSGRRATV